MHDVVVESHCHCDKCGRCIGSILFIPERNRQFQLKQMLMSMNFNDIMSAKSMNSPVKLLI